MNITVIDNLIPEDFQQEIEESLFSKDFSWRYQKKIWGRDENEITPFWRLSAIENPNVIDGNGFAHLFCEDGNVMSDYLPLAANVLYFLEKKLEIKIAEVMRIRARLTTQCPNCNFNTYSAPHFDYWDVSDYYTLVYYVNDSDGDTFLFEETMDVLQEKKIINPKIIKRISPKKGSGVFFGGNTYHAGNYPINFPVRAIINYDFKIKNL